VTASDASRHVTPPYKGCDGVTVTPERRLDYSFGCARAVVSDDGETIWLTASTEDGAAVPVRLSPVRAIAIASDLDRAALPKLAAAVQPASQAVIEEKSPKRRGRDPLQNSAATMSSGSVAPPEGE